MNSTIPRSVQPRISSFLTGLAASAAFFQLAVIWSLVCGTSLPSSVTLTLSSAVGLLLATRFGAFTAVSPAGRVAMTVVLGTSAWLLPTLLDKTLTLGVSASGSATWLPFVFPGLLAAAFTLSIVVWTNVAPTARRSSDREWLIGLSCGCLLPLIQAFVVIPLAVPITVAVVAATVAWFAAGIAGRAQNSLDEKSEGSDATAVPVVSVGTWTLTALGSGILLHAAIRTSGLLFPLSHGLFCVAASLVLAAMLLFRSRSFQTAVRGRWYVPCLLLLAASIPIIADRLIDLNLYLNATVQSPWLMLLLRSVQLAAFALVATGAVHSMLVSATRVTDMTVPVTAVLTGIAAGLLLSLVPLQWAVVAGVSLTAVGSALVASRKVDGVGELPRSVHRPKLSWGVAVPAAFACGVALNSPFNAADSALLLFNARSAQGYRLGLDRATILQSHSTRLLEEHNTPAGHVTIWRTSGEQVQLRRDGFPESQATASALITPQPVTDALTTIIPLVLHRNAGSIMLLGDDFGVGTRACCNFPLHTIRAVRRDTATTSAAMKLVWNTLEHPPQEDDRVTITHQPFATAIRMPSPQPWDVIVADSPTPTSLSGQTQFTESFYSHARSQLADDGIFCQRVTQHDIGSQPLLRIVSTIADVFGRVVMIRMAPGEIAVVAQRSSENSEDLEVLNEGILQRLERTHVGRELARSGWDWAQVAALPTIDTHGPVGLFDNAPQLPSATASNAHFAFAMPIEAGRWADKSGEIRTTFGASQQRLADAMPGRIGYDEFARRYSAVVQQLEILTSFPDEPWYYRKSLRTELQRSPRPPVEEVRDGKLVQEPHPLDEHRKNYFVALGNVLQQTKSGQVDALLLRRLADFTEDYEPLLSHFAHHELVRVHELASHPAPALELRHRLHTVYFTEGGDLSVRQVSDAIEQILDDPDLLANDQQRFDHVNSMLQELVRRWEGRRGYEPPSARRTQRDVDACVFVANRALDKLEEWSAAAGLTKDDIRLRRRFVNEALISPLRKYSETVLAHRIKNESPVTEVARDDGSSDLPLLAEPPTLNTN